MVGPPNLFTSIPQDMSYCTPNASSCYMQHARNPSSSSCMVACVGFYADIDHTEYSPTARQDGGEVDRSKYFHLLEEYNNYKREYVTNSLFHPDHRDLSMLIMLIAILRTSMSDTKVCTLFLPQVTLKMLVLGRNKLNALGRNIVYNLAPYFTNIPIPLHEVV